MICSSHLHHDGLLGKQIVLLAKLFFTMKCKLGHTHMGVVVLIAMSLFTKTSSVLSVSFTSGSFAKSNGKLAAILGTFFSTKSHDCL